MREHSNIYLGSEKILGSQKNPEPKNNVGSICFRTQDILQIYNDKNTVTFAQNKLVDNEIKL